MKETWRKAAATLVSAGIALSTTARSGGEAVVAYKGGKTIEPQYYNKIKESQVGQSTLANTIVSDALESQHGKDVTQKQVDKEYNRYKKQYGSQFDSAPEQNGMTASTFKDNLKTNLLAEATLKHIKKITPAREKKAWKDYQPEVTVQHALVSKKSTAKDITKRPKDGGDFKKLAKKYSTDTVTKNDAGRLSVFDPADSTLDSSFRTAAFKPRTGEITTTPAKTQYGYRMIKMIRHPTKGILKGHKEQIDNQIYQLISEDQSAVRSATATVLKCADVSIRDKDLKSVLPQYVSSGSLPG